MSRLFKPMAGALAAFAIPRGTVLRQFQRQCRGLILILCLATHAASAGALMSKDEALQMATAAAGGFLGTWVQTIQRGDHWYIVTHSKSAHPPMVYIVDGRTRSILFETDNADSVQLTGVAEIRAERTVIRLSEQIIIALPQLNRWPDSVLGKSVVVSGVLKRFSTEETATKELPVLELNATRYLQANQQTTYELEGKPVSEAEFARLKSKLKMGDSPVEGELPDGFTRVYRAKDKAGVQYEYTYSVSGAIARHSLRKK